MTSKELKISPEYISKATNQSDENIELSCLPSMLDNGYTIEVDIFSRKIRSRPRICHAKSYALLRLFIEHVGIPATRSCYKSQPHRHAIDTKLMNWLLLDGACNRNRNGISDCWIMLGKKLEWLLPILQQCNGNVNFADDNGQTILHIFLRKYVGTVDKSQPRDSQVKVNKLIKTLLEQGASVNVVDKDGNTPMHFATERKIKPLITLLLDNFKKINCQNNEGNTVLHILADSHGNTETYKQIICTLLSRGADPNIRNKSGNTPVHFAARHCQIETLEIFKKHGADFSLLGEKRKTVLHFVSTSCLRDSKDDMKKMKTIDFFVSEGCDVNAVDEDGYTALHHAASCYGSSRLMKKLIKIGADVKRKTKNGEETALHLAVRCDCMAIETLLKAGVNVNSMAAGGIAPLHYTILYGALKNMECLIKNGADLRRRGTIFDLTPMHMTALACKKKFELLASKGANVNVKTSQGITPLHLAAMMGNIEVVEALIDHGADIHCQDRISGWTPLHWAAMKGGTIDIDIFIDTEKHRDKKTEVIEHWKSLFVEAFKNQVTLDELRNPTATRRNDNAVQTLLDRGALMKVKDKHGHEAMYYVLQNNNVEGVKSLLRYGVDINDQRISEKVIKSAEDVKNHVLWHAMKLKQIGFPITGLYKFRTYHTDYWCEYRKCLAEVDALKTHMIGKSDISMFDFLHMNSNARFALVESASMSFDLGSKFPWYCDIIMASCREAVERKPLLGPAKLALRKIRDLPDLCVRNVICYLDNETLKALIYSTKNQRIKYM